MKISFSFLALFSCFLGIAQTNSYTISFENAAHHEAVVQATFPELKTDKVSFRMSRTSPGRYALHEFAKNVYGLKVMDSKGKLLKVHRPNPYEWEVSGHDGTIKIEYMLFANRGDGTYSQVDETHAHLNIPATFLFSSELSERKIEVTFDVREDLNWKVATQLPLVSGTTYSAPNLYYFMDSPTEISDFMLRSFEVDGKTINLALHHNGTEAEADTYFEKVKKVVLSEKEVYGELPDFDYGSYTFLACYIPNASGDGMEHRNSTIVTSTRSLGNGGMERNIGTVSHEFFHAWNVERIRPKSLEPFDFEAADMSGELWFAEGFTSYYTNLILCRAGLMSPKEYVEGLAGTFNYVWNSPALQFFNPIEMSYQAPFVDAATSVEPVNRENTFISYYSYGSVLGLALDLSLREKGLNLDDFMKSVWETYGKPEVPYAIENLHNALNNYAGKDFGDSFFDQYIYQSEMPDYASLLTSVGVLLEQPKDVPYLGTYVSMNADGLGASLLRNTQMGSPAYKAGLDNGDIILNINDVPFSEGQKFEDYLKQFQMGTPLQVNYTRFGERRTTTMTLAPSPDYSFSLMEDKGQTPSSKMLEQRKGWLKTE
ncbi:Predicted metalloprotease, contains C-terminal PDZ domain [Flagellimonas taeanensis]|uniref:Predicted metalloprotease, contains C-terminal PDZ domain n=1 Tax=Flagellimonas taeanensis TaxID=1005926 RepID=A0A1M6PQH6_9FLAO|nr:PDZ domain-containing protein [Allomuricauda taeanensis]SFB67516.1 Predicted metalloprotease, contains C-terminal PDZ domain [Allomuricauda taeanensis]SHK10229.1 Predicted metalloprotease, contains C-terminal PDZ domain [Allomuricauda taeanensis]